MPRYAIPVQFVVEAANPDGARAQCATAKQLLTQPFILNLLQSQGLRILQAHVADPMAVKEPGHG